MPLLNYLLLKHGKTTLKKFLFSVIWEWKEDNVNTIKIAAEKWILEIGTDFNVYTNSTASAGLLNRKAGVVVNRVKSNFGWGRGNLTTKKCPLSLLLQGRKEGLGGIGMLVTNRCAAQFLSGSVHGLPISMRRSALKVY